MAKACEWLTRLSGWAGGACLVLALLAVSSEVKADEWDDCEANTCGAQPRFCKTDANGDCMYEDIGLGDMPMVSEEWEVWNNCMNDCYYRKPSCFEDCTCSRAGCIGTCDTSAMSFCDTKCNCRWWDLYGCKCERNSPYD